MFCRQCGIKNADGVATCTACGAPLFSNPYHSGAAGGFQPMAGEKPKNYLVESILVTLCCCLPLGIVGIVFAAQVDGKWNSGDIAGAITSAENAKKFTMIGLGLGILINIVVIGIQILAVFGAVQQGGAGGGF